MALDFTSASLDSRVTITRAGNTATAKNSAGTITLVNANLPRFDYDPTSLLCKGLLVEEARTNLLLNSLINGANLSTQVVAVSAVAHTLSFYGSGQVVLSGAASGTIVGVGAYPSQKTHTFTPSAGVLTLTVTGSVQFAQLEQGSFATSFIPTDATTKTRNADSAVMSGANFSSWFNASEGTYQTELTRIGSGNIPGFYAPFYISDGSANNLIGTNVFGGTDLIYPSMAVGGASQLDFVAGQFSSATSKLCIGFKANSTQFAINSNAQGNDIACSIPTVNKLDIGSQNGSNFWNGWIRKCAFYKQRLTQSELSATSK